MAAPVTPPDSCATCKYFQTGADAQHGVCRRHPPVIVTVDPFFASSTPAGKASIDVLGVPVISRQPPVAATQWCGEWTAIK